MGSDGGKFPFQGRRARKDNQGLTGPDAAAEAVLSVLLGGGKGRFGYWLTRRQMRRRAERKGSPPSRHMGAEYSGELQSVDGDWTGIARTEFLLPGCASCLVTGLDLVVIPTCSSCMSI